MADGGEPVFQAPLTRGVLIERSAQKWFLISVVDNTSTPPKDFCLGVACDSPVDEALVAPAAVELVDLQIDRKASRNGYVKHRAKCAAIRAIDAATPAPEDGPLQLTPLARVLLVSRAPGRRGLVLRNLNSSAFMADAKWAIKERLHLAGKESTTPLETLSYDRFTQWTKDERSLFDRNHARDFSRVLKNVFTEFELGHRDWPKPLTQESFLTYVKDLPAASLLPPPRVASAVTVAAPTATKTLNRFAMLNMGDDDDDEDEDDDEEKKTEVEPKVESADTSVSSGSSAPLPENYRWAVPGGLLDNGRDAWDHGRHELQEEVSLKFADLEAAKAIAQRVNVPLFESKWVVASAAVFVVPTSTALNVTLRRMGSEFVEARWVDAAFLAANAPQDIFPAWRVAEKSVEEMLAALWAAAGAQSDPSVELARIKESASSPAKKTTGAKGAPRGQSAGKAWRAHN